MKNKFLLILSGLLLSILLLELGLRLAGFTYLFLQEQGNKRSLNKKGTYKILCLGESTTQWQYPKYLEEELNNRNLGIKFSVIDKGRSATVTNIILINLKEYLDEYKPDMVITMMGVNDDGSGLVIYKSNEAGGFYKKLKAYKLLRLIKQHLKSKLLKTGPETFIETTSKSETGYMGLGNHYLLEKKYKEAENIYKRSIEQNPEQAKALGHLSSLFKFYESQNRYDEAAMILEEVLNKKEDIRYRKIKADPQSLYFGSATIFNYKRLRKILKERNITYVCAQYPRRKVSDLKGIFKGDKGIIFVDNEKTFKDGVEKEGYNAYFSDIFGGNFGHCTTKGNKLLAKNIADTIIKDVFSRQGGTH